MSLGTQATIAFAVSCPLDELTWIRCPQCSADKDNVCTCRQQPLPVQWTGVNNSTCLIVQDVIPDETYILRGASLLFCLLGFFKRPLGTCEADKQQRTSSEFYQHKEVAEAS